MYVLQRSPAVFPSSLPSYSPFLLSLSLSLPQSFLFFSHSSILFLPSPRFPPSHFFPIFLHSTIFPSTISPFLLSFSSFPFHFSPSSPSLPPFLLSLSFFASFSHPFLLVSFFVCSQGTTESRIILEVSPSLQGDFNWNWYLLFFKNVWWNSRILNDVTLGELLSLPFHVEQCQALPCLGKEALLRFQHGLSCSWLKAVSRTLRCLGTEETLSAPAHSLLATACHMKTDFRGIGKLWGRCILEKKYPFTLGAVVLT